MMFPHSVRFTGSGEPATDRARTGTGQLASRTLTGILVIGLTLAHPALGQEITYDDATDFANGSASSVVTNDTDQLQLRGTAAHHTVVWVVQERGNTIVRLDPISGVILGEYRTAPTGAASGPSQVAIDRLGNAWVGNQNEASGGQGSIVKIGLVIGGTRGNKNADGGFTPDANGEYLAPPFDVCTAIDRDGDGYIHTSRGLGHRLDWPLASDASGGASTQADQAEDECILLYQRTSGVYVHAVARAANGDIWAGGYDAGPNRFDRFDAASGHIMSSIEPSCGGLVGVGGAGDVLWSADFTTGEVMRFDGVSGSMQCVPVPTPQSLATDVAGNLWVTTWSQNSVVKLLPDGSLAAGFPRPTGGGNSCGVAIAPDGDVWVANASTGNVSRLDSNGVLRTRIVTGSGPFGIDVAEDGYVWVTHTNHHNVVRIDPNAGPDGLGAVDMRIALASRANPEHRGDMVGDFDVLRFPSQGEWSIVFDGQRQDIDWGTLIWQGEEPAGTSLDVHVRAANDRALLQDQAWFDVQNGVEFTGSGVLGRHLEIQVVFTASPDGETTPRLDALSVQASRNTPPDVSGATPSVASLWPANHKLVDVTIQGLVDAEGDAVSYRITRITQDEPVSTGPQDSRQFDATGIGTAVASLRAERLGSEEGGATSERAGNGRVYEIHFVATDAQGAESSGSVHVCVPHDRGKGQECIDDGQDFDSTGSLWEKSDVAIQQFPNPFNPMTTIRFDLQRSAHVDLAIYDARGRRVRTLVQEERSAGSHQVVWNGRDTQGHAVASGWYIYRLQTERSQSAGRMLLLK